ncbi:GcrA family cell cycle regulator [Bradyrhizobium sp. AUGA SZCCT0160]|uniref:GcrA family cell cycle regulator n=1 Tax=Bradyrhizobium sp. AUGA SZCCT0160 TaxID=2807662 RepID=UPI001BA99C21|nr:GcrA family cell cycle regulator [Bradyrhizobium sp. AUGA SZCCT0160]MBR1193218.1 hypothetical protein [Bradyrhizobium sp. AUGA SZCCT0160]
MAYRPDLVWTDEKIEELKRHWDADRTCSQIAAAMGVTRNAIIGKAHRLGLPAKTIKPRMDPAEARIRRLERQKIYDARRRGKPITARIIMEAPAPIVPPDFVGDLRIPTRDLRDWMEFSPNQCRFIADEPPGPDYLACGNETIPGASYCPHCAERLKPPKQMTQAERAHHIQMRIRKYQRDLRKVA